MGRRGHGADGHDSSSDDALRPGHALTAATRTRRQR
jgi:hypothetical protein